MQTSTAAFVSHGKMTLPRESKTKEVVYTQLLSTSPQWKSSQQVTKQYSPCNKWWGRLYFKFGCIVDACKLIHSQSHTFTCLTRLSRMDSKAFILVFFLLSAAWLMSDTEALYGQNTDFNGRRSMTMVCLTLLYSLSSLTSVLITICQSII